MKTNNNTIPALLWKLKKYFFINNKNETFQKKSF